MKPKLLFITGDTSNGKYSLATKLKEHNYIHIEADKITSHNIKQTVANEIHEIFNKNKEKNIVIESAKTDPELIDLIFKDQTFTVIFMMPMRPETYYSRLMKIYLEDIKHKTRTLPFWGEFDKIDKKNPDEVGAFFIKKALLYRNRSRENVKRLAKYNKVVVSV